MLLLLRQLRLICGSHGVMLAQIRRDKVLEVEQRSSKAAAGTLDVWLVACTFLRCDLLIPLVGCCCTEKLACLELLQRLTQGTTAPLRTMEDVRVVSHTLPPPHTSPSLPPHLELCRFAVAACSSLMKPERCDPEVSATWSCAGRGCHWPTFPRAFCQRMHVPLPRWTRLAAPPRHQRHAL